MSTRAHIINEYSYKVKTHLKTGSVMGHTEDIAYFEGQTVWMGNRQYELYCWLIGFIEGDYSFGDEGGDSRWEFCKSDLRNIPDEAFEDDAIIDVTAEELKKFVQDCLEANPEDSMVRIDWY